MRRSTKGQIQIGETVAVLLVFIIIMVFGLYWFSTASSASVSGERAELARMELIEITKSVMNLPELQCSVAGTPDATCLDEERVRAFNQLIRSDQAFEEHYRSAFLANTQASYKLHIENLRAGGSHQVFDFTTGDENASQQKAAVPVVLYDPVSGRKDFSMLVLTQEVIA